MGKSGPKPKGKLLVIEPREIRHPEPLPGMTKEAKAIWKRVVEVFAPDHFKGQHLDQLRVYCESAAMYEKAVSEIAKGGVIVEQSNGVTKRNPWCNERDACAGIMSQIGTKLGLTKNATTVTRKKDGEGVSRQKSQREGLMFNGQ